MTQRRPGLTRELAGLFFDVGAFLFVCWGEAFLLFSQDMSNNNSKVQTMRSTHRIVGSQPKQVRELPSSTQPLHHAEGQ